ncbi:MAG: hypothetical protein IPL25_16580 [Saprospiraceae bacterium]|nr:hypothetical protein [Candidatus Vicinibacter affinis]
MDMDKTLILILEYFNQGNVTAQNINVVDYVPAGFQFIAGV